VRMWTKSACVVLAWSILLILLAVGIKGSVRPAQANIRIANSDEITLTSTLKASAPFMTATNSTARYVMQPGDALPGIAARFAARGGWQDLYAASRPLTGPDPNVIHSGTALTIPGPTAPAPPASNPGHRLHQPPPSPPACSQHRHVPVRTRAPAAPGMPAWLKISDRALCVSPRTGFASSWPTMTGLS
jgi:hypothetical protein